MSFSWLKWGRRSASTGERRKSVVEIRCSMSRTSPFFSDRLRTFIVLKKSKVRVSTTTRFFSVQLYIECRAYNDSRQFCV